MRGSRHAQSARPHLGGTVRRTVLPSGLRVVTEDMPGSETFALGFFVNTGSRDETLALHGAAHYLEHVLFKGTRRRTAQDISRAFDAIGGEANAYTAREHTCFYAKVMAADAPIATDIIADMLTSSRILAADVEAERDVILDEIAMHNDDPMEVAYSLIADKLFGPRALGRDVIGTTASIRGLTREQIASFWRRHYVPGQIVVTAAGRVDHDALVAQLAGIAGPNGPRVRRPIATEPLHAAVMTRARPLEQDSCVLAFRGPSRHDERRFATDLLALVLGGGMSSRLFVEVRERRGLAYHIDVSTCAHADAGQLNVEWLSAPDRVQEILSVVREVVAEIVASGVTAEELTRAKGQLRGQTLLAYESPDARMMRLGRRELDEDATEMSDLLDRYLAVTADDIAGVAAELLVTEPVLAVVGGAVDRRPLERTVRSWARAVRAD